GDAGGQCVGAHVDVLAVLTAEETEPLVGVVPLHLAGGHVRSFALVECNACSLVGTQAPTAPSDARSRLAEAGVKRDGRGTSTPGAAARPPARARRSSTMSTSRPRVTVPALRHAPLPRALRSTS